MDEKIVHGIWKPLGDDAVFCSVCGHTIAWHQRVMPVCPVCGSLMNGGE